VPPLPVSDRRSGRSDRNTRLRINGLDSDVGINHRSARHDPPLGRPTKGAGAMNPSADLNGVYHHAKANLEAGLSMLPVRRDGSKVPESSLLPHEKLNPDTGKYEPTWDPYKGRLPTDDELRRWFGGSRPAGIAVIGGKISGNLELLDFDVNAAEVFPEWCELVEAERPGLVALLSVVRTPREPEGYHVRYRCEAAIPGSLKLARKQIGPNEWEVYIETRGEGAYGLAPGSPPECHETGRPYVHHSGPQITDLPTTTADERETLIRCARAFDLSDEPDPKSKLQRSVAEDNGLRPGDDFDRNGPPWSEILESHGWTCVRSKGGVEYWRRPGKGGAGWSATTGKCKGKHGEPLLKVFSSSAAPFEEGLPYGRFRAFALLNHGGDLSAAAKELYRSGYGTHGGQQGPRAGQGAGAPSHAVGRPESDTYRFAPLTSPEFFGADWRPTWLVKRMLVKDQPVIIGAPKKSLKTTIACDLTISLATGGRFLGHFDVYNPVRTAFISGESGQHTIQETGRRVAASKGVDPCNVDALWGFDLPEFSNPAHITELCRGLEAHKVQALIVDPLYLCLLAGEHAKDLDAANLFHTGPLFRSLAKWVLQVGCTPVLVHHAVKHLPNPGEPMELESLAYSGCAEFARQWMLLNRREPYDPDRTGSHQLWLGVGGSCGQCGLWALDIEEGELGEDFAGRRWEVTVQTATEVRSERQQEAAEERTQRQQQETRSDAAKVLVQLDKLAKGKEFASYTKVRDAAGLSGARMTRAVLSLANEGIIEEGVAHTWRGKGKKVKGECKGIRRKKAVREGESES
jgi:hypothetical protein